MTKAIPVAAISQVHLKFTELPEVETLKDNWKRFHLLSDEGEFMVTMKPKIWAKLERALVDYPNGWTAVVLGIRGVRTKRNGWKLEEVTMQVFESKRKSKAEQPVEAAPQSELMEEAAPQAELMEEAAKPVLAKQVALEAMAG